MGNPNVSYYLSAKADAKRYEQTAEEFRQAFVRDHLYRLGCVEPDISMAEAMRRAADAWASALVEQARRAR